MSNRLDRIFIRAQKDGKWQSLSLNEVTDEQFMMWWDYFLHSRLFHDNGRVLAEGEKIKLTPEVKLRAVQALDALGLSPIELKEGQDE